ncbi:hypothetical protein C8R46DRAFT_1347020 [Mycena filopes]|nr:hypothetical protein C8R46DRAFT_1347020 [Mycena filopes]
MQCKFLLAFVISCLTLSSTAVPVAVAESTIVPTILDRSPEPVELARTPEPEPGCKLYSCI